MSETKFCPLILQWKSITFEEFAQYYTSIHYKFGGTLPSLQDNFRDEFDRVNQMICNNVYRDSSKDLCELIHGFLSFQCNQIGNNTSTIEQLCTTICEEIDSGKICIENQKTTLLNQLLQQPVEQLMKKLLSLFTLEELDRVKNYP